MRKTQQRGREQRERRRTERKRSKGEKNKKKREKGRRKSADFFYEKLEPGLSLSCSFPVSTRLFMGRFLFLGKLRHQRGNSYLEKFPKKQLKISLISTRNHQLANTWTFPQQKFGSSSSNLICLFQGSIVVSSM